MNWHDLIVIGICVGIVAVDFFFNPPNFDK